MQHFNSLDVFHEYMGWPAPEFALFSLISMNQPHRKSSAAITTDFYIISLKHVLSGELCYGRAQCDFSQGCMLFSAPGQSLEWTEVKVAEQGFLICIHKDYLINHSLQQRLANYGFFGYSVNEALHLSPREEAQMMTIYASLQLEYQSHIDKHSREIVLSLLDTLLKYVERYYQRQFIGRAEVKMGLAEKMHQVLFEVFADKALKEQGLPTIEQLAKRLSVSSRYLTDALKAETGKSAKEHIHLFLIDKAKNLLLESNTTVAEVAYELGFEYPQYFSRLFKSKTGVSPTEFQTNKSLH